MTQSHSDNYHCEVGILESETANGASTIFDFSKRSVENTRDFNAVFLVPTGIGAEIGGHAGDATPAARLFASVCDNLITHPNLVNASDINEMTDNTLYVEGSVLSRLLMGTVGIQPVRSNRVLAIVEKHSDELFTNAAINAINAARASFGLDCPNIVVLESAVKLKAEYASSGSALGKVENLQSLCAVLEQYQGEYDAVAIASVIEVPREYHMKYFRSKGSMVNPWGGGEAIFTHAISNLFNVPSAHSPMLEDQLIANMDVGIVDPRMAAEAVSLTFLQCILKGLHKAPRIISDKRGMESHNTITASDISCIVMPDGCFGLPTLAALEQGIPVIAVRENRNLMKNNLEQLPWKNRNLYIVDNYLEALGVMSALKSGVAVEALRRPLHKASINKNTGGVATRKMSSYTISRGTERRSN